MLILTYQKENKGKKKVLPSGLSSCTAQVLAKLQELFTIKEIGLRISNIHIRQRGRVTEEVAQW